MPDPIVVIAEPANEVVVQPVENVVVVGAPGPQGPPGPAGPTGAPGGSRYVHTQTTPATTWSVVHNLGYEPLFSTVVIDGVDVTDGVEIFHINENMLTITLSRPESGRASFL